MCWKTCSVVLWQSSRSFADLVFLFCCCFADLVFFGFVLFCLFVFFVCYSGVEGVLAIQKQFWIHISVKHCALAQSPYQLCTCAISVSINIQVKRDIPCRPLANLYSKWLATMPSSRSCFFEILESCGVVSEFSTPRSMI